MYDRDTFTIQLLYETTEYTQEVTLGIDAGYQTVGFSATTKTEEFKLRTKTPIWHVRTPKRVCHASKQLAYPAAYRPPRFDNRRRSKGWLAPSIQHKLDSHIRLVNILTSILPITEILYHQEGGQFRHSSN